MIGKSEKVKHGDEVEDHDKVEHGEKVEAIEMKLRRRN